MKSCCMILEEYSRFLLLRPSLAPRRPRRSKVLLLLYHCVVAGSMYFHPSPAKILEASEKSKHNKRGNITYVKKQHNTYIHGKSKNKGLPLYYYYYYYHYKWNFCCYTAKARKTEDTHTHNLRFVRLTYPGTWGNRFEWVVHIPSRWQGIESVLPSCSFLANHRTTIIKS